jgi:phenylpropionate dioxygenase-like ring-hydroxylating dioxygenase large terminal subunit
VEVKHVQAFRSSGDRSLSSLIDLDRGYVSREIYVNADVYQQELEQIYARAWLFVGHESMVPNQGDFVQSRMGEESVLLVRDHKNKLHVFLNTCRHRGNKVCRYDDGNQRLFTCSFHGWSYDTDGRLVGVPHFKTAFHEELDKDALGLHEVAQMANLNGSIWATWDPKAPSFQDYLGVFEPTIRRCFDASDGTEGAVDLLLPIQKFRIPTNWKFAAFSFDGDALHGTTTHRSLGVFPSAGLSVMANEQGRREPIVERGGPFAKTMELSSRELGHGGHTNIYERPFDEIPYTATWEKNEAPEVEEYYRRAWEKRARKYRGQYLHARGQAHVFPNVNVQEDRHLLWHPHGVGVTESWRIFPLDRDAPEVVKEATLRYALRSCGATGVTESDDMENWNYAMDASSGTIARRLDYPFQSGLGYAYTDERVPGMTVNALSAEENQRSRLRRWVQFMEARSWDELYPIKDDKD